METPCIIPYAPRPLQWRFHQQRTRFCVLLCHRRFGKTVAAVKAASISDLEEVKGISHAKAENIYNALRQ